MQEIVIKQFQKNNVHDYEFLTKHGNDGKLCYCSFWHQKWSSMDEYHEVQKTNPERLKNCVIDRMNSNFHVGVIAYENDVPVAWISVGPLTDFFWAWRRVAQIGENAKNIAGIMCFTLNPDFRGKGYQTKVLNALTEYGKKIKWEIIESYPFSNQAISKHGDALRWAGIEQGYMKAGFEKIQQHWLSNPDYERFIYRKILN